MWGNKAMLHSAKPGMGLLGVEMRSAREFSTGSGRIFLHPRSGIYHRVSSPPKAYKGGDLGDSSMDLMPIVEALEVACLVSSIGLYAASVVTRNQTSAQEKVLATKSKAQTKSNRKLEATVASADQHSPWIQTSWQDLGILSYIPLFIAVCCGAMVRRSRQDTSDVFLGRFSGETSASIGPMVLKLEKDVRETSLRVSSVADTLARLKAKLRVLNRDLRVVIDGIKTENSNQGDVVLGLAQKLDGAQARVKELEEILLGVQDASSRQAIAVLQAVRKFQGEFKELWVAVKEVTERTMEQQDQENEKSGVRNEVVDVSRGEESVGSTGQGGELDSEAGTTSVVTGGVDVKGQAGTGNALNSTVETVAETARIEPSEAVSDCSSTAGLDSGENGVSGKSMDNSEGLPGASGGGKSEMDAEKIDEVLDPKVQNASALSGTTEQGVLKEVQPARDYLDPPAQDDPARLTDD